MPACGSGACPLRKPRWVPMSSHPATKAAADVANGCCARYDIEIGAIEVQASKLHQQLEMASHAIALLTAARDRETEE